MVFEAAPEGKVTVCHLFVRLQFCCLHIFTIIKQLQDWAGSLQLMVAPLRRLGVNKPVSIEKVGSLDSVLSSIGPFISGKP